MEAGSNMQRIYKVSNTLLGQDGNWSFPEGLNATDSALATRFQRSFSEKINTLLCNLSRQPVDELSTDVTSMCFEVASPTDMKRIVLASAAKSCELGPLPSLLLKRHVDALSPFLARIINASLSSS